MPGCFLPQELCGGVDEETQVKEQDSPMPHRICSLCSLTFLDATSGEGGLYFRWAFLSYLYPFLIHFSGLTIIFQSHSDHCVGQK